MKNKGLMIAIISLFTVAALFGAARVVFGTGSTDIPVAYVISDGTDCYFINYSELVDSYMVYVDDPEADSAKLAKFYFDTLGSHIMDRFKAYVSGATTKFVNFNVLIDTYMETEDVNSTYMWFNGVDAAPAFSATTRVWVLDANCAVAGRYYVNSNGYIIRRSVYALDTTVPDGIAANVSTEFTLSVTSDDLGCDTLTGSLYCEVTGGSSTLEVESGGAWQTVTDGTLGPAESITPDWAASVNVRLTAHSTGTYSLKLQLKTDGGEVLAELTESVTVTGAMQVNASVPTFRVGETAQFTLSTIANGDAGRMVQAHFTIPSGATLEYLDSATGDWLTLPETYGPTSGFAVADSTLTLRGTFAEAGEKTITVQYIEVGTGTVLAGKDIVVNVEQPMTVTATLPEFYTNEPALFTLTTTAHGDAGKMVRAYFMVPSDAALEYQEESTGEWKAITDAYGPASGFAVADTSYTFRATFTGIGMKQIAVQFVEVGTGTVLADESFIATVQYRVQPTIIIPGFTTLSLPAGTAEASVDLANPADNTCLLVISIVLEDGTVLFTSGTLEPGESIGGVTLLQALSPGEYAAIVKFGAYDPDTFSPLNTAEVGITLIVK